MPTAAQRTRPGPDQGGTLARADGARARLTALSPMTPLQSHQTVRLAVGSHTDPAAGACVVELASMLAGEPFSDVPFCVCPVIAAFMRTYNDLIDDTRRQDLYPYAAAIVGSRATRVEERKRARLCRNWVTRIAAPAFIHKPFWTALVVKRELRNRAAANYAAMVAVQTSVPGERHQAALALVDDLLGVRPTTRALTIPTSGKSDGESHAAPARRELQFAPADPASRSIHMSQ